MAAHIYSTPLYCLETHLNDTRRLLDAADHLVSDYLEGHANDEVAIASTVLAKAVEEMDRTMEAFKRGL